MISVKKRLNYLDSIMAELAHAQMRTEISLKRYTERVERDTAQMKSDTAQMKSDTARMKEDTDRLKRSMDAENRKVKKIWGDLANKMGTVAEDVVAPNIPRLAVEEFGLAEVEDILIRARRTSRRGLKRKREYDLVCAGPGKVIVVEVKSTLTVDKIQAVSEPLQEFFDFFPEYSTRELIGVVASWSIDESLYPAISEAGLYGIAMGDETMDVVVRPSLH